MMLTKKKGNKEERKPVAVPHTISILFLIISTLSLYFGVSSKKKEK